MHRIPILIQLEVIENRMFNLLSLSRHLMVQRCVNRHLIWHWIFSFQRLLTFFLHSRIPAGLFLLEVGLFAWCNCFVLKHRVLQNMKLPYCRWSYFLFQFRLQGLESSTELGSKQDQLSNRRDPRSTLFKTKDKIIYRNLGNLRFSRCFPPMRPHIAFHKRRRF